MIEPSTAADSAVHATIEIERELSAAPARVFAAWAHADSKRSWFACHDDWPSVEYALDFRVGGRERNVVAVPSGPNHVFAAVYLDIVPDARHSSTAIRACRIAESAPSWASISSSGGCPRARIEGLPAALTGLCCDREGICPRARA